MMIRAALAAITLVAAPAVAQDAAPAPATAPAVPATLMPAAALTKVRLETEAGPIVLGIDRQHAPVTAANFLKYVDQKKLDGVSFYRAVQVAPGYGLAQFGTRNEAKRTLPQIAHEPTTRTGLSHVDGALSMAMNTPGTAAGDFFVVVGNMPSMDATAAQPGYAVFGRVIEGMDVVRRILAAPTSATAGEGVMKGQMLAPVIRVASARRLP
jgi:peptidyl-prolyl cis-trans isomerase A (cyclophilin A)